MVVRRLMGSAARWTIGVGVAVPFRGQPDQERDGADAGDPKPPIPTGASGVVESADGERETWEEGHEDPQAEEYGHRLVP